MSKHGARRKRVTLARVKETLHYDDDTGEFTWKVSTGKRNSVGQRAGTINHDGYRVITVDRALFRSARLAWFYKTGRWPDPEVDHINRVRSDDRWDNLREADRSLQLANREFA